MRWSSGILSRGCRPTLQPGSGYRLGWKLLTLTRVLGHSQWYHLRHVCPLPWLPVVARAPRMQTREAYRLPSSRVPSTFRTGDVLMSSYSVSLVPLIYRTIHYDTRLFHSSTVRHCLIPLVLEKNHPNVRAYRPIIYIINRPVASHPGVCVCVAQVQDFLKGGGEYIHKHPPPLGHCPRDVIRPPKNWKTPPLLDIHKHPPPLDSARVISSTFQGSGVIGPGVTIVINYR